MKKNSILIIDDEKANIITLTHILSPNYNIHAAKNGKDGIELANTYLPDVILLDIIMPEMDGFEVFSALKNLEKTKDIPVIFVTGLDKTNDEEKGLALGAADYITKPFSSAVVELRIRNQIKILEQRITEQALYQANAASKAKSDFLAKMSHNIRTPMNSIMGIADILLQDKTLTPKIIESLNKIYNSGELLTNIINDILNDKIFIESELDMDGMNQARRTQVLFEPMPYGSVLIVDDVESNLYVAKGLLAPYELQIDTAMSGFEAIDKIKKGKVYDIVFMDHMMPKMDGMEAVKIIREMGYTDTIVALTANALTGQVEIFMTNGFDGFISKPINVRELNTVLKKHITVRSTVNPQLAEIFIRDANKAAVVLEAFLEKNGVFKEEDIKIYTINMHAMKSALVNIGETLLSNLAAKLEQAGRDNDTALILSETKGFLNKLKDIVKKITPPNENNEHAETYDYDQNFLYEKMLIITDACKAYDKKAIKDTLTELMEKPWSGAVKEHLCAMSVHLLHSEFEDISHTTQKITDFISDC